MYWRRLQGRSLREAILLHRGRRRDRGTGQLSDRAARYVLLPARAGAASGAGNSADPAARDHPRRGIPAVVPAPALGRSSGHLGDPSCASRWLAVQRGGAVKRQGTLVLPHSIATALQRHLFPGDGLEAAALLLCPTAGGRRTKLLGRELILVPY